MPTSLIRRFPLAAFFFLAFSISWGSCIPFLLAGPVTLPILFIVGASGPTVAALIVVGVTGGKPGILDLLSGLLLWRVPFRWWAVALAGPPLLMAASIGIQAVTGFPPKPPHVPVPVLPLPIAIFLAALPVAAVLEEIGWRGYAQTRLESRHGPILAAVILGILWACWHLPLFLIPGLSHEHMSFGPYLAFAVVLCLWFGWLYRRTRSILLASGFHTSINLSGILGGGSPGAELIFGALVVLLTLAILLPCSSRPRTGKSPVQQDP